MPAATFQVIHYRSGRAETPELVQTADFDYNSWVTVDEYWLAVVSTYPGKTVCKQSVC